MSIASPFTTPRLLAECRDRGVQIWLDDSDQLRFRAPKGALDGALRDELRRRKDDIIAFLRETRQAAGHTERTTARPSDAPNALSFAQERLWFLDRIQNEKAVFVLVEGFRLRGPLSTTCLDEALRALIRRHPALRTRFIEFDGEPRAEVLERPRWHLDYVDLEGRNDQGALVREDASAFAARPFALDEAPLFRARLLRLAEDEHLLFLAYHHIIADDWSMSLLRAELGFTYNALLRGEKRDTPAPERDYLDFAWWQRERAASWDGLQRWWGEQLASAPSWDLPHIAVRPARQSYRGSTRAFALDATETAAVKRLAEQENATLFQVLLAGFALTAARLSGVDDLVLGTSTGARPTRAFEEVVGIFVNLLPLRIDLSGNPSVRELLTRVGRTTRDAQAHAELPFEKMVDVACDGVRDPSRHPLFQTQLVLTNAEDHALHLDRLEVLPFVDADTQVTRQDLSLVFRERDGELHCDVEYCAALFDGPMVDQLFQRLRLVLRQLCQKPALPIAAVQLIETAEQQRLLTASVADGPTFEHDLGRLLFDMAEQRGDAPALCHGDVTWSYQRLLARACQIAEELQLAGIEHESNVGICLAPGPELVAAIVGTVLAGATYVPLAPEYPADRLALMIGDALPLAVITDDAHEDRLPAFELAGLAVVNLDETSFDEREPDRETCAGCDLDQLAYVVYTSGTTGRPKGVQVSHRNVLRLVFDHSYLVVERGDGVISASNIAFDALTFELWTTLLHGGRLVIVDKKTFIDPEAFGAVVAAEQPAVMFTTTALFNQLARYDRRFFKGFKYVLFGGELVDPESVRLVLQDGPGQLLHVYGPTETTTFASWYPIDTVADDADNVPIGRPIAHTQLYVLDRLMQPVPLGVPGELYIGGAGVARGYLDRPALTAERFVPNPLAREGEAGSRLYRSGDLVRRNWDGEIEFLGRVDQQIKIRGFRIEPGEIEAHLFKHAAVEEAVVVVAQDPTPGAPASAKRLVAYIQYAGETAPAVADLRAFCDAHLPPHMIPAVFVLLDRLPLNPNGKVDRAALPDPVETVTETRSQEPRNDVERVLADIWASALGRASVGIHENFFELGGDSLMSIRIKAAARDAGYDFPLQQIFEAGTVAALAEWVVAETKDTAVAEEQQPFAMLGDDDRALLPEGLVDAYPMSRLQLGLMYHGAYESDQHQAQYQIVLIFRVDLPFDRVAMRTAVDQVCANHAILRTAFDLDRFSEPMQLVYAQAQLPLHVTDIAAAADREQWLAQWMEAERGRGFAWDQAPLVRLNAFTHGDDAFHLALTFHHVVMDGWSDAAMLRELLALYQDARQGFQLADNPPALSYRDFVVLEREALADQNQRAFWQQVSADVEPVRLGEDRDDHGEGVRDLYLSAAVSAGLNTLVRRTGAPLKSILLTAYLEVLRRLQGGGETFVGLVTHGRPEEHHGDRVLGLFVNMLPLRYRTGSGSWLDGIAAARAAENELWPHRRFPLAALMEDRDARPLFDAVFNFTHFHLDADNTAEDQHLVPIMGSGDTHFSLLANFGVEPGSRTVNAHLRYNRARLAPERVAEIGRLLEEILRTMTTAPEQPMRRFEATAARALIAPWTRFDANFHGAGDPLSRFRAQAARNPQAVALIDDAGTCSYGELSARVNRVAQGLLAHGVTTEEPIGICLDGGMERVIATLGILAAGATYVPLDRRYPAERLALMVNDLGIRHVIGAPPFAQAVAVHSVAGLASGQTDQAPTLAFHPHQAAYVMFTSGSTGKPKGVAVTRANIEALVDGQDYISHDADQVFIQSSAFGFDAATLELYAPLTSGARLVTPTEAACTDLPGLIQKFGVTAVFVTPRLLDTLIADHREALVGLRELLTGGDVPSPESSAAFIAFAPQVRLQSVYGPTEATTFATTGDLRSVWSGQGPVPLGLPLQHTAVYLLDEDGNPCAPGMPGEIFIAGARLARGYVGNAAQTASRFVPNPFVGPEQAGARMYRTGDRAVWRDGALQFLGRMDRQVKLRGFRIEPGEVERALCGLDAVSAAYVTAVHEGERAVLAAWAVVGDSPLDGNDLRRLLSERVPAHLVPGVIHALPNFPLNVNGKLDKKALPPALSAERGDTEAAPPQGPMEQLLANIWCDLFDRKQIHRGDHFLALGGNSIDATRLVARLRRTFNDAVPIRLVFEQPVLHELARALSERGLDVGSQAAADWTPVSRDTALPLSFAQEGLYAFEKMTDGDTPVYLLPEVLELRGDLNADLLEQAFRIVIAEQESLRTRFDEIDGRTHQWIQAEVSWQLDRRDISALDQAACSRLVHQLCHQNFDLQQAPLMRVHLLQRAPGDALLVTVLHHIIADGWSLDRLRRDWLNHYRNLHRGNTVQAQPSPLQVADYAVWQQERWRAGKVAADMAWWQNQLADCQRLELPTDRPRPAVFRYQGAVLQENLGSETASAVAALARRNGVPVNTVLLAAFHTLLARLSGQDDVACGIGSALRPHPALENVLGCFVNLLVLRGDLSDVPSFETLVKRTHEGVQAALAHADAPFEKVAEQQGETRGRGHHPLVGTHCVYVDAKNAQPDVTDLPFSVAPYAWDGVAATRNDVTFLFRDDYDGLNLVVEYNSDLYDAATMGGWINRFKTLLTAAVQAPTTQVSVLPMLDADDQAVVKAHSNNPMPLPNGDLAQLFAARVAATPDAVAIEDAAGDQPLSFAELDAWSAAIAAALQQQGVGLATPVGLCLQQGPAQVAATLAIVRLGGVYVPLTPDAPAERLAYMIADSALPVIISDQAHQHHLPPRAADSAVRLLLDDCPRGGVTAPAAVTLDDADLAYIVYTSGTTGRPKGVQISHGNVKRLVYDRDYLNVAEGDGFALASNIAFDAAAFEMWTALLHGARLVPVPKATLLDPPAVYALIRARRIDIFLAITALFNQYAQHRADFFQGMKVVLLGGEKVDAQTVAAVLPQGPQTLLHVYGPSESTTLASWYRVEHLAPDARNVPVGGPIGNTELWLLDRHGRPVPRGVVGELYIGGAGLARGYQDRPALTAERFVPHPFSQTPGARLYRTGDLMRRLHDGALEFIGRTDDQLKIRGYRIEPAEIEAVLRGIPGVAGALVDLITDDQGKRFAAWLEVGENTLDARAVRDQLAQQVPDYMVPAAWALLPRFPITTNTKIDRRRLPQPTALTRCLDNDQPANQREQLLADVWCAVLRLDAVGVTESFVDLGGDSLLAIQIKAKAADRGLVFPLRALFETPTIRQIVAGLDQTDADTEPERDDRELVNQAAEPFALVNEDERAGLPDDAVDAYPLSHLQQGMLFHGGMAEHGAVYHDLVAYGLALPLDNAALRATLDRLTTRHPVLRTSFHLAREPRPLQIVHGTASLPLTVVDWRGRDDAEPAYAAFIETEKEHAFDWTQPPLMRVFAHQLADKHFRLTFSFHHAVLDGWSEAGLFTQLLLDYRARLQGATAPTPTEALPYRAYIALEQATANDSEARDWWRTRLAGAETSRLAQANEPLDVSSAATIDSRVIIPLDAATGPAVRRLATALGVPLKTVALTAHLAATAYLAGNSDVLTGLVTNGRPEVAGAEATLGLFLNTVPIRLQTRGLSWRALAARVYREEQALLARRRVPLAVIQADCGVAPLFETAFNYTHFHVYDDLGRDGMRDAVLDRSGHARADFPLFAHFAVDPDNGDLHAHLEFEPTRLHPDDAARAAAVYAGVLQAMCADPDQRADQQLPLTASDRQLLQQWQQGPRLPQSTLTLDGAFAAQAKRTPAAVALRYQGKTYRYGQLARAVAALATRLRAAGIGQGDRVGVCLDRQPQLPVALLAVMQVGAAYVPLDPDYPQQRLRAIAEDAAMKALIGEPSWAGDGSDGDPLLITPETPDESAPHQTPTMRSDSLPTAPAYVIYTSGSTGRPKGVVISHGNAATLLGWAHHQYDAADLAGVLAATSVCFDLSIFEWFVPLSCGGSAILADNALALNDLPDRSHVTLVNTVPSAMQSLLPALDIKPRVINLAGEPLHPQLVDDIVAKCPTTRVFDLYGPSEATTYATGVERTAVAGATIGAPLANVRAYVLDAGLRPVAPGTLGELYLGGPGVVLGYLGRPGLTAAGFVPDPFGDQPGARLYRTGDLVRRRGDGLLTFHGRRDHQIKLRGYRIELGEIEAVIKSETGVQDAAVIVVGNGAAATLAAFVAAPEAVLPQLGRRLSTQLPGYMVPHHVQLLADLPRLPNGKLNRAALVLDAGSHAGAGYRAPVSDTERAVAAAFAAVLAQDPATIGCDDDFFERGGQSLLAVRLTARLQQQFAIDLAQRDLFEQSTVAGLADHIDTLLSAKTYLAAAKNAVSTAGDTASFDEGEL